jgi:hypothetical protein
MCIYVYIYVIHIYISSYKKYQYRDRAYTTSSDMYFCRITSIRYKYRTLEVVPGNCTWYLYNKDSWYKYPYKIQEGLSPYVLVYVLLHVHCYCIMLVIYINKYIYTSIYISTIMYVPVIYRYKKERKVHL